MLNRRRLLAGAGAAALGFTVPGGESSAADRAAQTYGVRGMIDAAELGALPDVPADQSRTFAAMFAEAERRSAPLFLPAGTYVVSNLALPRRLHWIGVPGATRIVYGGDGHLLLADGAERLEISGIAFDGAQRWLSDQVDGLLEFRRVAHLAIDACEIVGSGKHGLSLKWVAGRVERSEIAGAADAGLYSLDAAGRLQINGNAVTGCGNGGILVHRSAPEEDGTLVVGNRVSQIAARAGGTGQNGNGINVFRANAVTVASNQVSDCAFSAIRANGASNLQIGTNTCLRSGETAIYAEFAFEGAVINANIVDGAANGISIVNFDHGGRMGVCSSNIVRNLSTEGPYRPDPPGFGIGIAVEADCAVTGNVVESAPNIGINIGWGEFMRNVVATGNVVRRCGTGIGVSVVEGTGAAVIADNIIEGAVNGAIVGHRWAEPATGDLAQGSGGRPANITVERNRVG
ncbi:MAG: TIGR03808 family TAT-translocated repetitive protein [Mesorhizobium sp.]